MTWACANKYLFIIYPEFAHVKHQIILVNTFWATNLIWFTLYELRFINTQHIYQRICVDKDVNG